MPTDEQLIEAGLRKGLVDSAILAGLRLSARRGRTRLLDAVTHHGRFPIATLYRAFADQLGIPFVDAGKIASVPENLFRQFPAEMISFLRILPVSEDADGVCIATADPDNPITRDTVARAMKRPILFALSEPAALDEAIIRLQAGRNAAEKPFEMIGAGPLASSVEPPRLLDQIFREAFVHRASDIHFSPQADGVHVRLRVDGRLQSQQTLGRADGMSVISRIKVLAGLDIAEQRSPQDGGFSHRISPASTDEADIRVATSPTRFGERATLRILGSAASSLTLGTLGLPETEMERFHATIRKPHGLILLTGPTGSGKSTTLYAALREINRPELNILTVEDPIECHIPGISQIEMDGTKTTFARTLRALLRHDPDVLMVGEIRDAETADVALKAATTGHLVFSTLHTSSAFGAIARLIHLGCPPYLVGETLVAVLAQRLIRRLCPRCRKPRLANAEEAAWLGGGDGAVPQVFEASGCAVCLGQGFQGRVGLFETLWIDRSLARRITRGEMPMEGEAHVGQNRMTLREDGRAKVIAGITSLDEARAVIFQHEMENS